MAILKRSAYVLAAAAFFSAPAAAQVTISGVTTGCFYTGVVACTGLSDPTFAGSGLTFAGNTFSVVSNGTNDVQLTGADRLGVFTMANPANFNFTGWKFALFVNITSPSTTSPTNPQQYLAVLDPFNTTSGDKLDINFGIDTYLFTYNGGVFTLQADAIQNLRLGDSQDLTGKTACNIRVGDDIVRCGPDEDGGGGNTSVVPEPSTYLLMATGLMGLGIAARRRRNS